MSTQNWKTVAFGAEDVATALEKEGTLEPLVRKALSDALGLNSRWLDVLVILITRTLYDIVASWLRRGSGAQRTAVISYDLVALNEAKDAEIARQERLSRRPFVTWVGEPSS